MEKVTIKASKRDILGKRVGALRREGKIPGVVYGHGIEPISIIMDRREATRSMAGLTSSSIITVDIDGEKHPALIREKQRNYLRNEFIHVDFQAVSLTEKIRARIEVVLSGNAPAVKDFNGVVVHDKEYIEVESFPADLPERFIVNIDGLANIGDSIRLSDMEIAKEITVFDDANDVIVSVSAPKLAIEAEEEAEAAAAATAEAETAEPEVVEKGKKEEAVED